jgi:hypothetical protein
LAFLEGASIGGVYIAGMNSFIGPVTAPYVIDGGTGGANILGITYAANVPELPTVILCVPIVFIVIWRRKVFNGKRIDIALCAYESA